MIRIDHRSLIARELFQLQTEIPTTVTPVQFGLFSLLCERRLTLANRAHERGRHRANHEAKQSACWSNENRSTKKDPADGQRRLLTLTPAGQKVCHRAHKAARQTFTISLDSLDDAQHAQSVFYPGSVSQDPDLVRFAVCHSSSNTHNP
jgi:hypothetical protein